MSNAKVYDELPGLLRRGWQGFLKKTEINKGCDGQILMRLAAEKMGADNRRGKNVTQKTLSKRKGGKNKKHQAGSTSVLARRKPTRAVCSGWSYPIQAELSLVLGGVPVQGLSCGSSASDRRRRRVRPFTRLHRQRAEPGSSPHCPSETP